MPTHSRAPAPAQGPNAPSHAGSSADSAQVSRVGTLSGTPLLKRGATGPRVRILQQLLNEAGAGLRVDGDFGPRTLAAVQDFQRAKGLGVDGIVGPSTASALNGGGGGEGGGPGEYTVAPGDTLAKIAGELLGDEGRWREIYELNRDRISNPNRISIGQKLRVPGGGGGGGSESGGAQAGGTYTVQAGDTLTKIAERVTGDGSKWRELYEANRDKIRNPSRISVGWVLTLPSTWNASGGMGGPGPEEDPAGGEWRPGGGAEAVEGGAYTSVYGGQSQGNPLLQVDRGQLTFDAEGTEGGRFHTRRAHWPGGNSGVTIGRGYDMGLRSRQTVQADLIGAGVPLSDARKLAQGAGLRGNAARDFCSRSDLPEIGLQAQKHLFDDVYLKYVGYVVDISERSDVVSAYGRVDWDNLNPYIMDLVVDLRYRGDYTATTRRGVQPLMVANDLSGLKRLMADRTFWSSVPEDRFRRRKLFAEEGLQAQQSDAGGQEEDSGQQEDKDELVLNVGSADPRGILSESRLNPQVKMMAAKVMDGLIKDGWTPYLYEGWRSYARQDSLSSDVTGVSGGGSYHQYGLAVDIAFMDTRGNVTWNAPRAYWNRLGELGLAAGFTRWGGDWGDMVHLEFHPGRGPGERARSLQNLYRASGGYRDTNVEAGLQGVWEALGLPTEWDQVQAVLQISTGWEAVINGSMRLRNGSSGAAVEELQRLLNGHGFALTIDGAFGPLTEQAVRAFQSASSLIVDGIVGAATAGLLQR